MPPNRSAISCESNRGVSDPRTAPGTTSSGGRPGSLTPRLLYRPGNCRPAKNAAPDRHGQRRAAPLRQVLDPQAVRGITCSHRGRLRRCCRAPRSMSEERAETVRVYLHPSRPPSTSIAARQPGAKDDDMRTGGRGIRRVRGTRPTSRRSRASPQYFRLPPTLSVDVIPGARSLSDGSL
jgi:hypothetical protein